MLEYNCEINTFIILFIFRNSIIPASVGALNLDSEDGVASWASLIHVCGSYLPGLFPLFHVTKQKQSIEIDYTQQLQSLNEMNFLVLGLVDLNEFRNHDL